MKRKHWFISAVVTAFASAISFFQINSYWADKHHFNGFFGWLGIGLFFLFSTIFLFYKVAKAKG